MQSITNQPVLSLNNVRITYNRNRKVLKAVDGVSFDIYRGKSLCLVGESGSGKTTIALAIPLLLPETATINGTISVLDSKILELKKKSLFEIRRKKISMIFQDAVGSLIPGIKIGIQLGRALKFRTGESSKKIINNISVELLESVGLSDSERILESYPNELSGGMCQRVMIALALSVQPELLIADEPISSIDEVSQIKVLKLLLKLQREKGFSMLFVTHDLRVASRFDNLGVLRNGKLIDYGSPHDVEFEPSSEYTKKLYEAIKWAESNQDRT